MTLEITMDGLSAKGIRKENQDTFFAGQTVQSAFVIDGVGSLPRSKAFAHSVREYCISYLMDCYLETWLEPRKRLVNKRPQRWLIEDIALNAFYYVHDKAFYAYNNDFVQGKLVGASTLTMMLIEDNRYVIAHVGDSNVYRLRQGYLERLTRPDAIDAVMEDLDLSSIGETSNSLKNVLLQAIGIGTISPNINKGTLKAGDVFLLCTDGIDKAITQPLMKALLSDPNTQPEDLIKAASTMDSKDNMTAVLVRVYEKGTQKKWWQFWK